MIEADPHPGPDPEDAFDRVKADPRPEPNPMRSLKHRLDSAEKAAKAWEARCVEAEGRLSAANGQARFWQAKYDELFGGP